MFPRCFHLPPLSYCTVGPNWRMLFLTCSLFPSRQVRALKTLINTVDRPLVQCFITQATVIVTSLGTGEFVHDEVDMYEAVALVSLYLFAFRIGDVYIVGGELISV